MEKALDNEIELRQDGLYGTALMLKALCLWRLSDLEDRHNMPVEKMSTETEALACPNRREPNDELYKTIGLIESQLDKINLGQRDRVLLKALPGLRDHDRGLRATDYDTAKRFFESSLKMLDASLEIAPPSHPVRVYIRLAQLSTCRAWQSAAYKFSNDVINENNKYIVPRTKELIKDIKPTDQKQNPDLWKVIEEFERRLGLL